MMINEPIRRLTDILRFVDSLGEAYAISSNIASFTIDIIVKIQYSLHNKHM